MTQNKHTHTHIFIYIYRHKQNLRLNHFTHTRTWRLVVYTLIHVGVVNAHRVMTLNYGYFMVNNGSNLEICRMNANTHTESRVREREFLHRGYDRALRVFRYVFERADTQYKRALKRGFWEATARRTHSGKACLLRKTL